MESKGLSSNKEKPIIFISHRSTDKDIADMLADFFYGTGIPRDTVFCSSLPGNDVNEKISHEVKTAIKNSAINIVILSRDYYQSAYCLNEAGILWYRDDVTVVPIALPEINYDNMYGFLGNEYKLRRLNSDTDIAYIYGAVRRAVSAPHAEAEVITSENKKLMKRYAEFLKERKTPETEPTVLSNDATVSKTVSALQTITNPIVLENNELGERDVNLLANIVSKLVTDDERIVLYYILEKCIYRTSKPDINEWLYEDEIDGVNVDNAFELLSSFNGFTFIDNKFELDVKIFREIMLSKTSKLSVLKECVYKHKKLAFNTFRKLWENVEMRNPVIGLFIAYIIDEKVSCFRCSVFAYHQIESIKNWERKNSLNPKLSKNYNYCIRYFSQKNFVYYEGCSPYAVYY